jgi:hypothetical protein
MIKAVRPGGLAAQEPSLVTGLVLYEVQGVKLTGLQGVYEISH